MKHEVRLVAIVLLGFIAGLPPGCTSSAAPPVEPDPSRIPVAAAGDVEGVRVAVFWDARAGVAVRKVGARLVTSDEELQLALASARDQLMTRNPGEVTVTIDAAAEVPWRDLVHVVALCKDAGMGRVAMAVPAP